MTIKKINNIIFFILFVLIGANYCISAGLRLFCSIKQQLQLRLNYLQRFRQGLNFRYKCIKKTVLKQRYFYKSTSYRSGF